MAYSKVPNIKLVGVAAAVPNHKKTNKDIINRQNIDINKVSQMVGVQTRYVAEDKVCCSDLCYAAAEQLLIDISWSKDTIDAVIFVSQTPDYILPATACILQNRLNLSKKCAAFDINLGCSGYVYGLLVAYNLISASGFKRILLLVGDTVSKLLSNDDTATNLLFGDAGTATAIEYDENALNSYFVMGTDGAGAESLMINAGGFRIPSSNETCIKSLHPKDNVFRSEHEVFMDGPAVFSLVLFNIPSLIRDLFDFAEISKDDVDIWLLHQANKFILDYLINKMDISETKCLTNMKRFGNTSPASIPLLMVTEGLQQRCKEKFTKLSLVGFGVGFSWGGAILQVKGLITSDLLFI